MENTISLTKADLEILESYKGLCAGLSDYLGDGFEFVLHSLEDFDHSVIKIINGYHTGRVEGAPITDLALDMLSQIKHKQGNEFISYFSKNKYGEPLKSSTIAIKGEGGRIIGLLCINFYMNTPLSQLLTKFVPQSGSPVEKSGGESYVNNSDDLIQQAVSEVRSAVISDSSVLASNRNKEIIARLYNKGIFNLKDSVVKCAQILGISKNTVYLHLRNVGE